MPSDELERARVILATTAQQVTMLEGLVLLGHQKMGELTAAFDREIWLRTDDETHLTIMSCVQAWLGERLAADRQTLDQLRRELIELKQADGRRRS